MATNLEFIKSASGTSVTTFEITDCFSDKYDVYYVSLTKVDTSADCSVYIQTVDSGGANTGSNYDMAGLYMRAWTTFAESKLTNQTAWGNASNFTMLAGGNSAYDMGVGFYVFNPYDSSSYTFIQGQQSGTVPSGKYGIKHIGVYKVAEQITGLKFGSVGGTVTFNNITVNVYGVK
jgi:hypothetical protein